MNWTHEMPMRKVFFMMFFLHVVVCISNVFYVSVTIHWLLLWLPRLLFVLFSIFYLLVNKKDIFWKENSPSIKLCNDEWLNNMDIKLCKDNELKKKCI